MMTNADSTIQQKIGALSKELMTSFATSAETQKWYRSRHGAGVDVVATWDDEYAAFKADGFVRNYNSGTISDIFCQQVVGDGMQKAELTQQDLPAIQSIFEEMRLPDLMKFLKRGLNR